MMRGLEMEEEEKVVVDDMRSGVWKRGRKESGGELGGRREGMVVVVEKAMMAVLWSGRALHAGGDFALLCFLTIAAINGSSGFFAVRCMHMLMPCKLVFFS